ncbi:MAG: DUF3298 domain-containing protein [Spirochaetaceae bacterium]|nr:DUF3298 domain-containing protein [Spirochaetaceae bacterium]
MRIRTLRNAARFAVLMCSLAMLAACGAPKPVYTIEKWYFAPDYIVVNEADPSSSEGWRRGSDFFGSVENPIVTGGVSTQTAGVMNLAMESTIRSLLHDGVTAEWAAAWDGGAIFGYWNSAMESSYPAAEDGTVPTHPAWYLELKAREVPWGKDFIQWSFVYDAFTGGKSPRQLRTFLHLDPRLGTDIRLDSLATSGAAFEEIRQKLWQAVLAELGVKNPAYVPNGPVLLAGDQPVSDIHMITNQNWQLDASGLTLVLNPGIAAPAEAGAITVAIPAAELKGLLKGF